MIFASKDRRRGIAIRRRKLEFEENQGISETLNKYTPSLTRNMHAEDPEDARMTTVGEGQILLRD